MKYLYRLFLVICLLIQQILPCTTAIVSAKASSTGRPLLLKNRDSDYEYNSLAYFSEGKYTSIGLINSVDAARAEVWAGMNSAGLAIMNSASYNLKPESDTTKIADREGIIIKMALQSCATVDEFESLLKSLPRPLGVEANFGVIDAFGGAAYFETDNFTYKKYDVNDPSVAPDGYLIRTNFSCSGDTKKGYGHIRFATASELFADAFRKNAISTDFLLHRVARCLSHSATRTNLEKQMPQSADDTTYVPFQDFIPRNSTSAVVAVEGIKKGEKPNLTTMWVGLGFSLSSIVVPVWIVDGGPLPEVMVNDGKRSAPAGAEAVKLKHKIFSYAGSEKERYLDLAATINKDGTGIFQKASAIEGKIATEAVKLIENWRNFGIKADEVKSFYNWVDETLKSEYIKQ